VAAHAGAHDHCSSTVHPDLVLVPAPVLDPDYAPATMAEAPNVVSEVVVADPPTYAVEAGAGVDYDVVVANFRVLLDLALDQDRASPIHAR
jgi:hypothetical protein